MLDLFVQDIIVIVPSIVIFSVVKWLLKIPNILISNNCIQLIFKCILSILSLNILHFTKLLIVLNCMMLNFNVSSNTNTSSQDSTAPPTWPAQSPWSKFKLQVHSSKFIIFINFNHLNSFLMGQCTADSLITSSLQYKCVHNFSEVYTCTIEPVRCNCTVPGASLVPRPRHTDQSQQSFDLHATLWLVH